jgi:hypothetical protein
MSLRKLLVLAAIAGLVGSATACADITAPQPSQSHTAGFCAVTGSGQTCDK